MSGKILLLNPPAKDIHIRDLYCSLTSKGRYLWPPIDLLIASGFLKERFELEVVDAVAARDSADDVLGRVAEMKPSGILSLAGSASWTEDSRFFKRLKTVSAAPLVVTGDLVLDPGRTALSESPEIDAFWTDMTAPGIVRYFQGERPPAGIAGMAFKDGCGRLLEAPAEKRGTLTYPIPRHDLFPLKSYRLPYVFRYPFSSVLTNFGCPFTCSYCVQSRSVLEHRHRPAEETIAELRSLRRMGVREVYFRDPLFESDRAGALELCRLLERANLDLSWSCNCRVDTFDGELAAAMKRAGCSLVAFGFESANEGLLRSYSKPTTLAQARRAVDLCRREGLMVAGYWILGLPGETYASSLATIDLAVSSGIDFASFSMPSPDHGTPFRERAVRNGKISPGLLSFDRSRPVSQVSDLTERELASLRRIALRRFYFRPGYVWRMVRIVRSWMQFQDVLSNFGACVKSYLCVA